MKQRDFIKMVKRIGKENKVSVRWDASRGKGSHGTIYYGQEFTTVPHEVNDRAVKSMLKQLGIQ